MSQTETSGQTTTSNGQSASDSSVFSEPFSGPFIIETVGISIAMIGIIGAIIALAHISREAGLI